MKGTVSFNGVKKELLKNSKIKSAYNREHARAMVALQIAELREQYHLSQEELAKQLHTTQQAISKIESPDNNITINTLDKIAGVFKRKLVVKFT